MMRQFAPVSLPGWLPRSEWPFDTFAVQSADGPIAVSEAGRGPTLLLAHVGTWSFIWRELVLRLAPEFRCVFFDAPGNGLSREGAGRPVTIRTAARAVTAVVDALHLGDVILVAHDLAGPAAMAAFAAAPHKLAGLVAMNAFAWRPSGVGLRAMLAIMGSRPIRELDALTGFLPRLASTPFGIGRRMNESGRAVFRAGMPPDARRAFHEYMRDALRADDVYDQIAAAIAGPLARIPVLTIFGERNDPFGFQKRWKRLYPRATQVVVAAGNHFPMCDDPDLAARAIRDWHHEEVANRRSYEIEANPTRHA